MASFDIDKIDNNLRTIPTGIIYHYHHHHHSIDELIKTF